MGALYFLNALAVLTACWALWVRRLSFASRWDGPITVGVALYGLAAALDTPWPPIAAASFPLTGKHYFLPALGHICYLAGTAAGIQSVYARLLPDDELAPFMNRRIRPVVVGAAVVMLVCLFASPVTSTMPAHYLYGVPLDPWLQTYFVTYFLTFAGLLWTAVYGGYLLRKEPGSGAVLPLMGTASTGSIACLGVLFGILSGRSDIITSLAWPVSYLATAAASLVCGVFWLRRVAELSGGRR